MNFCGGMPVIPGARVLTEVPARCFGVLGLVFLGLLLILSGCQREAAPRGTVQLWVTRDYGREVLFSAPVPLKEGQSVLGLLSQHVSVQTAWGGRFVERVAGLASASGAGGARDWFFSVNGITAHVGAAAYRPEAGDVIWWDYRPWGASQPFLSAAVGAWPRAFTGSYHGRRLEAVILYGSQEQALANDLATLLAADGGSQVPVRPYSEASLQQRRGPALVIALWPELAASEFWQGLAAHWMNSGWLAQLTPEAFYPLALNGGVLGTGYSGPVAAILAAGSGLGDHRPVWLVTALEATALASAVNIMVEQPQALMHCFGVLLVEDELVRLPVR